MTEEKYLTSQETADILGLSVVTIHRYLKAGELPGAVPLGGRAGWRIPQSAIDRWAAKRAAAAIVQDAAADAAAPA